MQLLNFINVRSELEVKYTAGNESKYSVISGPCFPVFGLNTKIYSVNLRIHPNTEKYGPEITPYLDIFTQWYVFMKIKKYRNIRAVSQFLTCDV